jgi:hypothetical protein
VRPITTILCSLLGILVACDGATRVRRTVYDSAGQPIRGAIATLAALDAAGNVLVADTMLSQSNGYFSVFLMHSPFKSQPLLLRVEHTGFQPHVTRFTYGDTTNIPSRIELQQEP